MPPAGSRRRRRFPVAERHRVQVRLTKPYRGAAVGDRVLATPGLAEQLERQGIAVLDTRPAVTPRAAVERAVAPIQTETR